jgi:pimeloyl-ACP methyl ester carboxylesterase
VAKVVANGIEQHVQQMAPAGASTPDSPAPIVVFIHGILVDSLASYYFTLAKPFADAGIHTVMYDLRGHGRSERPLTGYTLTEFVDDLAALLDRLGIQRRVYLIGNSFGGTVAFSFAARHPEHMAGIAIIESEPATALWATKMTANLDRATTQLVRKEALAWITVRYGRRTTRLAKAAAKLLHSTSLGKEIPTSPVLSTADIRAIGCPLLAIYGGKSDLAAQAPLMRSLFTDCITKIIPGQEHSVLIEVPETVRDLLLSWITDHERAEHVRAEHVRAEHEETKHQETPHRTT